VARRGAVGAGSRKGKGLSCRGGSGEEVSSRAPSPRDLGFHCVWLHEWIAQSRLRHVAAA